MPRLLLIVGRRQLEQVVHAYVVHHTEHLPHRSLEQRAPLATAPPAEPLPIGAIQRHEGLGGLLSEYYATAA